MFGVMVLFAAAAAAIGMVVLVSIVERKQEARNPFSRWVEIHRANRSALSSGVINSRKQDTSMTACTVNQQRTRYGGSEAKPRTPTQADPRSVVAQSRLEEDPRLKTMWARPPLWTATTVPCMSIKSSLLKLARDPFSSSDHGHSGSRSQRLCHKWRSMRVIFAPQIRLLRLSLRNPRHLAASARQKRRARVPALPSSMSGEARGRCLPAGQALRDAQPRGHHTDTGTKRSDFAMIGALPFGKDQDGETAAD